MIPVFEHYRAALKAAERMIDITEAERAAVALKLGPEGIRDIIDRIAMPEATERLLEIAKADPTKADYASGLGEIVEVHTRLTETLQSMLRQVEH